MPWQPVEPETYVSQFSAPVPQPSEVFAAPGYSQPKPEKNTLATVAIVFGIVGVLFPVFSVGAVICGHIVARDKVRGGAHLARGGLALGYASLGVWALFILSAIVISQ